MIRLCSIFFFFFFFFHDHSRVKSHRVSDMNICMVFEVGDSGLNGIIGSVEED